MEKETFSLKLNEVYLTTNLRNAPYLLLKFKL